MYTSKYCDEYKSEAFCKRKIEMVKTMAIVPPVIAPDAMR
jgi:hypothetical protein